MIVTMFSKANFGLSFQIHLRRQRSTRAFVTLARSNWLVIWLLETRAYVYCDSPVTKSFGLVMTS